MARGGQILATRSTREALGDGPLPVTLRPFRVERLRGIPEPVELWEVVAQG